MYVQIVRSNNVHDTTENLANPLLYYTLPYIAAHTYLLTLPKPPTKHQASPRRAAPLVASANSACNFIKLYVE